MYILKSTQLVILIYARMYKVYGISTVFSVPQQLLNKAKDFERWKGTNLLLSASWVLCEVVWTVDPKLQLCVFIYNSWTVFWLLWLNLSHHLCFPESGHPWRAIIHNFRVPRQHSSYRPNDWWGMQMTDGSLVPNICNSNRGRQRQILISSTLGSDFHNR